MNKSESIKELAGALAKAQAEMPAAKMNATNPFLDNHFADLGSIISTARPVLKKYGLAVSQFPINADGSIGITTILMHESGEWLETTISLPLAEEKGKSVAQAAGSIITYLRRYSLSAVLNMYADEDTDGDDQTSTAPKKSRSSAKRTKQSRRNNKPSKWRNFLADNELTEEKALKALGHDSVIEWMKANPGKTATDAHAEILQILGLS